MNQGQTGPKSPAGKAASASNSIKSGVFSQALMPWEDPKQFELLRKKLARQWDCKTQTQESLVRQLAMLFLRQERVARAISMKAQAYFSIHHHRIMFCENAGISQRLASELPAWFFTNEQAPREHARHLRRALAQAHSLMSNYSELGAIKAHLELPDLYEEVMGTRATLPRTGIIEKLRSRFAMVDTKEDLQAFIDELNERHALELLWAKQPERLDAVAEYMRSQVVLQSSYNEGLLKAEMSMHRQVMDITQRLSDLRSSAELIVDVRAKSVPAIAVNT
jgi:hypothetical protein